MAKTPVRDRLRHMTEAIDAIERLRGALDAGEASGPAREFDFETFKKELDEEAIDDRRA
jgi:Arc/MetJ-type ribon-helix-helix transcriptional regulator